MSKPLRVLIIEDSEDDTQLVLRELQRGGYDPVFARVDSAAALKSTLDREKWDIVISDYSMPRFSAPAALALVQERGLDLPFIIVSGTIGEETAVATMKAGAHDYLMKGSLKRLAPVVERELREAEVRRERKRAEEALREREQQLSSIYDTVADVIFHLAVEKDGRYRFISVNQAFLSITGLDYHQLVGKRVDEVIPEPSLTLVLEKYREAIREKRIVRWEETSEYPMGRLTGEVSVAPVFDDAGKCTHLVGAVHDITERKRTEEQIRKLSSAIEQSPSMVMITDPRGTIEYINPTFTEITGYLPQEVIGKKAGDLGEQSSEENKRLWDTIISGGGWRGEFLNRRKKGELYWEGASISPIRNSEGIIIHFVKVAQDITERRRMQEALRQSEERLNSILQSLQDVVWSSSLDDKMLYLSPAAERIYGRPVAQVFENPRLWLDIVHPEDRARVERGAQVLLENGSNEMEYRIIRTDGEVRWVYARAWVAQDANGVPIRKDGIVTDITERKRLEEIRQKSEELEEQNRRFQEANRLKGEFLANVSHELRTPLNAVIGFAELLYDEKAGPLKPNQKEYMGDILTSGRHLLSLINDVLDLAKVESGKMEFRAEPVNLEVLVGEVTQILRALAAQNRISVETEIDRDLGEVILDQSRLKQVLYNYLSNAIKFTPDEGRVTIRVRAEGLENIRMEVEDTGIGIRPEEMPRLFVEFQQLDASLPKKYQGTGLGLALIKRIVEAQGGAVGVRSTPGKGSTFFAILPRIHRPGSVPEAEPKMAMPVPPRIGAPTVLIIEDEPKDRAWLAKILAEAGYAVETVATGAEALTRCQDQAFDAVLLDLLLPDMSGWDVLRALRATGPNQDVPVIVATVVADKGSAAGFHISDFWVKPVQADQLLASLARAGVPADGNHRILVVDDDPRNLRLAKKILTQWGFKAICESDGERALRVAAQQPPSAVVLDLLMPNMDGFEFLWRLRRTAAGRRIPVLIWTQMELTAQDRARLARSAQAVVLKSAGAAALVNELQTYLPKSRASKEQGNSSKKVLVRSKSRRSSQR